MNGRARRKRSAVRGKILVRAREMRRAETAAEHKLWMHLRNRAVVGAKFRRQYPIESFIVDFCCPEARLMIEVDGPTHEGREQYDAQREARLRQLGYRILRVSNADVLLNIEGVLEAVHRLLAETVQSGPHLRPDRAD